MMQKRILKKIGGKIRDESCDIVEARLPERLRTLLERLARVDETHHGMSTGHGAR